MDSYMHIEITVKGLFYYGDLSLKMGLFVKLFLEHIRVGFLKRGFKDFRIKRI